MRRAHLVFVIALIVAGTAPGYGAHPGSVSGRVCDSSGAVQIGAEVQLLRPDLSVVASVTTNTAGRFVISSVPPGLYSVKAIGTSFLPSLREDIHVLVRTRTVVNFTLNTLYEVMEWLPSKDRSADSQPDDWKWTLRSAANRPLLRWLEDGPLLVESDGTGTTQWLKARLIATGQEGTFGESGERVDVETEDTPGDSRALLAQVDFEPGTDADLESMLGFRQELGLVGSVQSVAAMAIHPEIGGAGGGGLEEAAVHSSEEIHLGDEFSGEVGSTQVLARFQRDGAAARMAALPFANVAWHGGNSTVHYGVRTAVPTGATDAQALLPGVSMRDGQLAIEHGLHQEVGWERNTGNSRVGMMVYSDRIENPVLEAAMRPRSGDAEAAATENQLLCDPASGLVRTAGPAFSSAGIAAFAEHRLHGDNRIRVSYATGDAIALTSPSQQVPLSQLIASAHARRAQTYSISLSGTLKGRGAHWRATYRWQPEETTTPVEMFAADAEQPYLNVQLHQPLGHRHDGGGRIEAVVGVRNVLAEGYQPYVLNNRAVLVFAQAARGVSGGLAFTF